MSDKVLIEEREIDLTNMFEGMEIGDILQRGKKKYEVEFFGNTEVTVSTEMGDIKNIYFEDLVKYKNLSKMERNKDHYQKVIGEFENDLEKEKERIAKG